VSRYIFHRKTGAAIVRHGICPLLLKSVLVKTLAAFQSGILSCYDYRISSAPWEGTNNKIKPMKLIDYEFRDMEFLKLKIMAVHETKYALV
jgi:transposase